MFCANYKVGEGFEFSREELGVKDEQQIDIEISCIKIFEVSGWEVLLLAHFIVAFFDLIRKIYVGENKSVTWNFAQ